MISKVQVPDSPALRHLEGMHAGLELASIHEVHLALFFLSLLDLPLFYHLSLRA